MSIFPYEFQYFLIIRWSPNHGILNFGNENQGFLGAWKTPTWSLPTASPSEERAISTFVVKPSRESQFCPCRPPQNINIVKTQQ